MTQTMTAIAVEQPGKDYRLVTAQIPRPSPGKGEVLVKVAAAGINRADLMQAMGAYPPPPGASATLGLEISGTIAARGAGRHRFCGWRQRSAPSSPAAAMPNTPWCRRNACLPVPKGVGLVEAAALPEAHFTVWTNLMDAAKLKPGESVLIHGGSSGIGTTAIQLCVARGHTVFTTAGSADKCAACEQLGATRAINYREEDFVEVIKEMTGGKGVDVILDMVGGDYIEKNFRALAVWGRLVNIAFMGGMQANVNFGLMLMKRLSFMATTLRARSNAEKGAIRDALAREVWPLIEAGKIKPVVDTILPLKEAQAAHQRMASSSHIGKILLTP